MKPLGNTELKRLHREWRRRTDHRLALLLDSVETPFNVGSILRTAAAWRVEDVWATDRTSAFTDPKVQKTAMGSDRFVREHRTVAGPDGAALARTAGYRIVAVELVAGATPVHEADLTGDVCLVVGHEDRGVSSEVLATADTRVFIPQLGRVGSLNVATAAAVAIYEARRQTWTA